MPDHNIDHLSHLMKRSGLDGEKWLTLDEFEFLEGMKRDFLESGGGSYMDWLKRRTEYSREVQMLPMRMSEMLYDVVCRNEGLEEYETKKGWPARSAKFVLKMGTEEVMEAIG